jgi:DNA-directed RNA polymerase specialized sigma24 family protein
MQPRGVEMNGDDTSELVKYTKALLALHLQSLNKTEEPVKPEVLLARAGLAPREIAELLGKNQAAVVKTLERSRKAS